MDFAAIVFAVLMKAVLEPLAICSSSRNRNTVPLFSSESVRGEEGKERRRKGGFSGTSVAFSVCTLATGLH